MCCLTHNTWIITWSCQDFESWHYPPSYATFPNRPLVCGDISDENLGPLPGHFVNLSMVPMWRQTWGNPSTRRGIASVDGANASQGFVRPRIPPMSLIAQVAVVGTGVLGVAKHNGVTRGERHGKPHESGNGMEGRAGRRRHWCTPRFGMVPTSCNQVSHMDE